MVVRNTDWRQRRSEQLRFGKARELEVLSRENIREVRTSQALGPMWLRARHWSAVLLHQYVLCYLSCNIASSHHGIVSVLSIHFSYPHIGAYMVMSLVIAFTGSIGHHFLADVARNMPGIDVTTVCEKDITN
jgi:hypothetical protein